MKCRSLLSRLAIRYILFLFLGISALVAVFCLPDGRIGRNVALSRHYIQSKEGIAFSAFFYSNHSPLKIDNFTNDLMLQKALGQPDASPAVNALSAGGYARYWHGYLVFLRPLLMLGSIELIRYLNMLALTILLGLVLCKLYQRLGPFCIPALLFALGATWFLFVPMSLQYAAVYYILLVSLLVLLHRRSRRPIADDLLLFFTVGMATSYFDLLTAPLLTLGLPLLTLLALQVLDGLDAKTLWKNLFLLSSVWGLGYGAFWAAKWVLATMVLEENVIWDALKSIAIRLQGVDPNVGKANYSALSAILENIKMLLPFFPLSLFKAGLAGAFCILVSTGVCYCTGGLSSLPKIPLSRLLPPAAVCLYPFLWYSVLQNHSTIHAWFTCKALAIPIFGAFLIPALALGGRGRKRGFSGADSAPSPLQTGEKGL